MPPVLLIAIAVAPAGAILLYYLRIVRRAPEPWFRVAAVCVFGVGAFYLAAEVEHEAAAYIPRSKPWLWCFAVIGPVEETLKLLAVLVAAPWPARYERVSSGLMYGVAAGVGFACVENIVYVLEFGAGTGVMRAATAVPAHALQSAIVGLGVGVVHRTHGTGRRLLQVGVALMVAIVLHATYDALLLGAGNLRGLVVIVVLFEVLVVRFAARRVLERDLQKDMDLLASVPLFHGVPAASLRILAAGSTRVRVWSGTTILRAENTGSSMFQIVRGTVEVRIDDEVVATLKAGDFFGELALLTEAPRSADVIARTDVLLMRVHRRVLLDAVRKDETLAEVVIERARARADMGSLPTTSALVELAAEHANQSAANTTAVPLEVSKLLRGLSAEDLETLRAACVTARRGRGAKLVRAGRTGPGLYFILSGQATATLGRRRLSTLVEGDDFGEISLLTGWNATATVTASSAVELAVLRWIDLEPVIAKNPALGLRLLTALEGHARRGLADPSRQTAIRERFWRVITRAGRVVSPLSEGAERMFVENPDLQSLPRSAAETLAKFGVSPLVTPDGRCALGAKDLEDAIARCPYVVRFLARLTIRRVLRELSSDEAASAHPATRPIV